ncbi:hypothetical protein [Evansella tamaricis]|uniref:TMhelix containing protein n=1 Tax=Evansella tamaricis TaxID=2069301 RepID=A0ABS6JM02_9BACI|nr:hypothetical protein [Evansella tamaricis]MBU9714405.1 hypothetical protein [Evansella tamaricis]
MITLGTVFIGIATALLAYNTGLEHGNKSEVKEKGHECEIIPVTIDEAMKTLENDFSEDYSGEN